MLIMLRLRWLEGCDQDNVDRLVMGADTNARDESHWLLGGLIGFNSSVKRRVAQAVAQSWIFDVRCNLQVNGVTLRIHIREYFRE